MQKKFFFPFLRKFPFGKGDANEKLHLLNTRGSFPLWPPSLTTGNCPQGQNFSMGIRGCRTPLTTPGKKILYLLFRERKGGEKSPPLKPPIEEFPLWEFDARILLRLNKRNGFHTHAGGESEQRCPRPSLLDSVGARLLLSLNKVLVLTSLRLYTNTLIT